jgi:hypothetical protein
LQAVSRNPSSVSVKQFTASPQECRYDARRCRLDGTGEGQAMSWKLWVLWAWQRLQQFVGALLVLLLAGTFLAGSVSV